MRLSKTGYYADFVIYAALLALLTVITAWRATPHEASLRLLMALLGALTWTLLEYLLHRFVLHRIPVFAAMHDTHHQTPRAFVGTPTWLSLGVIGATVFLPTWALGSLQTASGLTVGVMAGFFWYSVVHHAIHFRRPRRLAARLPLAARRHARHHYTHERGNFGVTTPVWDRVFGTALARAAGSGGDARGCQCGEVSAPNKPPPVGFLNPHLVETGGCRGRTQLRS